MINVHEPPLNNRGWTDFPGRIEKKEDECGSCAQMAKQYGSLDHFSCLSPGNSHTHTPHTDRWITLEASMNSQRCSHPIRKKGRFGDNIEIFLCWMSLYSILWVTVTFFKELLCWITHHCGAIQGHERIPSAGEAITLSWQLQTVTHDFSKDVMSHVKANTADFYTVATMFMVCAACLGGRQSY